jgi:hypothetical protein
MISIKLSVPFVFLNISSLPFPARQLEAIGRPEINRNVVPKGSFSLLDGEEIAAFLVDVALIGDLVRQDERLL